MSLLFIGTGYTYINKFSNIKKSNYLKIILFIISIFGIIICYLFHNNVDMCAHRYGNVLLFLLGAYSGIYIMLFLSQVTQNCFKKLIPFLGKNTLIIMCIHEPIKRIVMKIFSMFTGIDTEIIKVSAEYSIIITIIIIAVLIPIIIIINKYFPFCIGKFEKKK